MGDAAVVEGVRAVGGDFAVGDEFAAGCGGDDVGDRGCRLLLVGFLPLKNGNMVTIRK